MTYYAVHRRLDHEVRVRVSDGAGFGGAAQDDYFTSFITSPVSPVVFGLLFMAVTAFIVYKGVEGGIEKVSKFMMPVLLVLVVIIAIYSLTLKHEDADGNVRTGFTGLPLLHHPAL